MKLSIKQTIALDYLEDDVTKEIGYGGGAGGGKSILGCYWQLKRRLKYSDTRGLIGRAQLKTLKETTLQSFFFVCNLQGLKSGIHYKYNAQSNQILFPNKSIIYLKDLFLYPSDPNFDELGSLEITDAFIDESAQVTKKAFDIVGSRMRYNLDTYGLIPKILWTSNPSKNWNYNDFYKPFKDGTLPSNKKFIQSLVADNPNISRHYIDNLNTLTKVDRERLLLGNWEYEDNDAALMTYDKIIDLFTNSFVKGGGKYITADIARLGRDKTVICVWDGLILVTMFTFDKNKVTEAADKIKYFANRYEVPMSNVIVDGDGVGGGVEDILQCKGFTNNANPIDVKVGNEWTKPNYANLKSQCYFKLAEMVQASEIYIKDETHKETIIQELEQVQQYNMDKDGKRQVLPKDKIKEIIGRSPDYSDAIMMRMWFELKPDYTKLQWVF